MENLKNPQKMLAREYVADISYGTVYSEETRHFIIYYTKEGEHAVKVQSYIDSLAKYLEDAYNLHTSHLGMKSILGATQTKYYKQNVPAGLYPVEVIDTGLGDQCDVLGLVFPPNARLPNLTQIAIENDFIYGTRCPSYGKYPGEPFISPINGDYSKQWHLALKVTTYHELYHSFQLSQFDIRTPELSFWLEASATGVEEIGAPEVNDYISYLSPVFSNPGVSAETASSSYGFATLYLFLYSKLDSKFDSHIWDNFKKYPRDKFGMQLARYIHSINTADSLNIDAEDLFHEYARNVFFSGKRALPPFWQSDLDKWPTWNVRNYAHRVLPEATIDFVRTPIGQLPNTDSAKISLINADSSIWALSRLLQTEFVPPEVVHEFIAYPNPWNPQKHRELKFKSLPKDSKGVEIRTSNGALLERINSNDGKPITWIPKRNPAPGILYYRSLPYGKNKVLIVEY